MSPQTLSVDYNVTNFQRVASEHQASADAKSTDCAVALRIDLWRFDVVFLQASFKRRQIETAVFSAESIL
jgi:hypothetical protein